MNMIMYSKPVSLLIVLLAYTVAVIIAFTFYKQFFTDYHLIVRVAIADIVATVVIFLFSYFYKNSSIYDPYWSVIPVLIFILFYSSEGNLLRNILLMSAISAWAVRLTYNWAKGWAGMQHADWRYVQLKKHNPKVYWLISFSGIHLFPTALVFIGCIPAFFAMKDAASIAWLDLIAFAIIVGAVIIQYASDEQMRAFRSNPQNADKILGSGLWKYSRHPNYFGEIMIWLGIWLFSIDSDWCLNVILSIGFILMVLLFIFISIPMMEKKQIAKRPGYIAYKKNVSVLVPWFPKTNENLSQGH